LLVLRMMVLRMMVVMVANRVPAITTCSDIFQPLKSIIG
jgi:hypothetical protein